jgi:hypothetical protein
MTLTDVQVDTPSKGFGVDMLSKMFSYKYAPEWKFHPAKEF